MLVALQNKIEDVVLINGRGTPEICEGKDSRKF